MMETRSTAGGAHESSPSVETINGIGCGLGPKNVINPYERPKVDIEQCLLNHSIPERDKHRLRELQAE
ncbi:hypothetical protein BIW11_09338, partial [Tropilaelaps mercedesae]